MKQRPWRSVAYWIAPHSLFMLLSYETEDHLFRRGTAQSELGPPTLAINQENAPQTCLWENLMGDIF